MDGPNARIEVRASHHRPTREGWVIAIQGQARNGHVVRLDQDEVAASAAERTAARATAVRIRNGRLQGNGGLARAIERKRLWNGDILSIETSEHVHRAARGNSIHAILDGGE